MLICFDLDGTLTNPQKGIVNAINYTLEKLGEPTQKPEALLKYIGPTVSWIYKDLLGTCDERIIAQGRQHFSNYYKETGYKQNHVYPGIPSLLSSLSKAGHTLCVVTAKSTTGAIKVLKHFELHFYFDGVFGRENDREKTQTLNAALNSLAQRPALMVGDRCYDMEAAVNCQCLSIGVLWGFGDKKELLDAGAEHLIAQPSELFSVLSNVTSSNQ